MNYLLCALIAAWLCGLYLLATLNVRDAKMVARHITPDEQMREQEARSSEALALRGSASWLLDALFLGPALATAARMFGRIFNLDGSGDTRATRIDPARLTEDGRQHLARAIRNERMMYAWMAAGGVLLVYAAYYFKT